jgi:hypothetical protein
MLNYCYECGAEIDDDLHFCNISCASVYKERHGDKFLIMLGKQTKLRHNEGIPAFNKESKKKINQQRGYV